MKKFFIIIIIAVFALNLFGKKHFEQDKDITDDKTLKEVSLITEVPVGKLIEYTGLNRDVNKHSTLNELNLSTAKIKMAVKKYHDNKLLFFAGIIIVGMLVVFSSLLIVGIVVVQLKKIVSLSEKKTKPAVVEAENETKRVPTGSLGEEVIAAVFTAIYLYEAEIEEKRRQTSFFRTFTTNWRALNPLSMPNLAHKNSRLK